MRRVQRFDAVKALESLPPAGEQLCKIGLLLGCQLQVAGQPVSHGTRRGSPAALRRAADEAVYLLSGSWALTGGWPLLRPLAVPQIAKGLVLFLL